MLKIHILLFSPHGQPVLVNTSRDQCQRDAVPGLGRGMLQAHPAGAAPCARVQGWPGWSALPGRAKKAEAKQVPSFFAWPLRVSSGGNSSSAAAGTCTPLSASPTKQAVQRAWQKMLPSPHRQEGCLQGSRATLGLVIALPN